MDKIKYQNGTHKNKYKFWLRAKLEKGKTKLNKRIESLISNQ